MIKLSVIIPAYNAEPYIHELIERLEKQIKVNNRYRKDVQIIVIDDGSVKPLEINKPWIEFYKNDKNRGISYTRNRGLELAKGKFIHFVDADDNLAKNYFDYIINIIDTKECDYIDLSWKSLTGDGPQFDFKLNSDKDFLGNPSASTRIFKRSFIGDHRFSEKKDAAEDADFTRHLDIWKANHVCATEYMYFYRTYVKNSNSKQFINGEKNTQRIGYYYRHFTENLQDVIEKIKKDDEQHEVLLLTNKNDVPEIEKYCKVVCPPTKTRVMEFYGEPCDYFSIIPRPIKTQVVVYASVLNQFGGIETFVYTFCQRLKRHYDIMVLYKNAEESRIRKLEQVVRCERDIGQIITCDTLVMNKIADLIPENVKYKRSIQVLHAVYGTYDITPRKDRDKYIAVSDVVRESYKDLFPDFMTIRNMTFIDKHDTPLLLVSSTRLDTPEKGQRRMIKFANLLKEKQVPFLWFYFSNRDMAGPSELIRLPQNDNIAGWVEKADYLIQLSDTEGMSYSILEAMELGTKIICTPLPMLDEIGFEEGKHGYKVPFDLADVDVTKFINKKSKKSSTYDNKNTELVNKWRKLLGNTKPQQKYDPDKSFKYVKVTTKYYDIALKKELQIGDTVKMSKERADIVCGKGYGRIV